MADKTIATYGFFDDLFKVMGLTPTVNSWLFCLPTAMLIVHE